MNINELDSTTRANVEAWLNGEYDDNTKQAINEMLENDPKELIESFYRNLEFGTGGLRGIMGVGTNRMNRYTVAMATQGLANYIIKCYPNEQSLRAAISHDSRNHSREFAEITASVLAANGFHVYLFEDMRPTPELSFAVRHFKCHTGVMLTASHNPKEYNGYKAYWCDGCQLTPPHDTAVIDEVLKIKDLRDVKMSGGESNIETIGSEVDKAFQQHVVRHVMHPECITAHKDIKIVYTPLHGTGITMIPQTLSLLGFTNVHVVKEQAIPNGNFPTTPSPNPEEQAAMSMAVSLGKQIDADIVMASDPDADRVGIAVKRHDGEWSLLNGNQTLSIIIYYLANEWKRTGKITGNEFIVSTIVTSKLPGDIARKNGIECYNVLTGFKWIGLKIRELEGKATYIGGGEESYGYMIGDFVRDKDAISACCMIAEIAAWAASQGKSFFDVLVDIYKEYGFYKEGLVSIVRKGREGADEIKTMMHNYRQNPPKHIDGSEVVMIKDFQTLVCTDLTTGKTETLDLPKSNVLQFFTADGCKITVRPSGTEPKIKFYFSVKTTLNNASDFDKVQALLDAKIESIKRDMSLC